VKRVKTLGEGAAVKRVKTLGVRVTEEENERLEMLLAKIRVKVPYIDMAKLMRELIGLVDCGLVTEEDRQALRVEASK